LVSEIHANGQRIFEPVGSFQLQDIGGIRRQCGLVALCVPLDAEIRLPVPVNVNLLVNLGRKGP
jgi:hypothetical protein